MSDISELISSKLDVKAVLISALTTASFSRDYTTSFAYVVIFDRFVPIEKTGTFKFGVNQLRNVMNLLQYRYRFDQRPLRFALFVFSPKESATVETTVELTYPMALKGLKEKQRRQIVSLIVKTANETASGASRKTNTRTGKGPQTPSAVRASPEVRSQPWTSVTKQTGLADNISTGTKIVLQRTYTSVRTSQFRKKQKSGTLPINPHTCSIQDVAMGSIYENFQYVWTSGVNKGLSFQTTTRANRSNRITTTEATANHLSLDQNRVIARLRSGIGSGLSSNLGEDAVQVGQTLRLFTNSLNRLSGAFQFALGNPRGLKKISGGKSFSAATSAEILADLWLEYRYGWIPLLQSIDDYKVALFSTVKTNPIIQSVAASAKKTANSNVRFIVKTDSIDSAPVYGYTYTSTSTKVKIGLRYKFDSALVNTASQLGLTGPTNLVWNLIPFSFVVDWFLPIGAALESFSAFDGLSFVEGYKTTFTRKRITMASDYTRRSINALQILDYAYSERVSSEGILLNREVLTGFPTANAPRLKNPLSVIHAANAAALITKFMTGKR